MTVPEKGPGGGVIGFCTPVREILRPNQGIISLTGEGIYSIYPVDPHTVPRYGNPVVGVVGNGGQNMFCCRECVLLSGNDAFL